MAEAKTAEKTGHEKPVQPAEKPRAKKPGDGLSRDAIIALFPKAYLECFGGVADVSVVKEGVRCGDDGKPLETVGTKGTFAVSTSAKRIRNGFRVKCGDGKIVSYDSDHEGTITRETQMPFLSGVDTGFPGIGARFLQLDTASGKEFWTDAWDKQHYVDPKTNKVVS
jgi:hypothetical protein